ncbi:MAG TPA: hypothetical protein VFA10_30215 [Ktedonobacteraceae bacterium]|nr:hypothetical protein [Ktedonobacteraceae bacterium]
MSNEFQHGDRVELACDPMTVVGIGDTGTVTHLNGDGEPGTASYWPALDGNRVVWVAWDSTADGEPVPACWTPKDNLTKLE